VASVVHGRRRQQPKGLLGPEVFGAPDALEVTARLVAVFNLLTYASAGQLDPALAIAGATGLLAQAQRFHRQSTASRCWWPTDRERALWSR
jgi:hypothetical protein